MSGALRVDGVPIAGASLDRGVVFQDYSLFPWMTAGDNLLLALKKRFPGKKKAELKEIALSSLRDVGLGEDAYKKLPKELSGGMQQRVAIAQVFSTDPSVLLMDEPFGALDAVTRAKLQDLIARLCEKARPKKTVFFVTHDVDEAMLLADRVVVLGQSPSRIIYEHDGGGKSDAGNPVRQTGNPAPAQSPDLRAEPEHHRDSGRRSHHRH